MKYTIFNHTLESDIPLPELPNKPGNGSTITFKSRAIKEFSSAVISWSHHWRLPNGQITISVGQKEANYLIHFPNIAYFQLNPENLQITSYSEMNVPDESIRHLLLDQVVPRLLNHLGQQILHASCVKIGNSAIAFCGESGWGKSTLASFFYSKGCTLLTDDCLLLENKNNHIYGIPSYQGIRLFNDSLSLLPNTKKTLPVSHYSLKKRLIMNKTDSYKYVTSPLSAIFVLNNPQFGNSIPPITIEKIQGARRTIELIKHGFPLDITDKKTMGKQLMELSKIGNTKKLLLYDLEYPRDLKILPTLMAKIKKLIHHYPYQ